MLTRRAFTRALLSTASLAAVPAFAQDPVQTSSIATAPAKAGQKLATQTEILVGQNEMPMISPGSVDFTYAAIAMYEEFAAGGGWPELSVKQLKKGNKGDGVIALRHRLVAENYLPFETLTAENANVFDDELADAVRAFQINHGVLPSGIVAEKTLAALNVSAETRLRMLQREHSAHRGLCRRSDRPLHPREHSRHAAGNGGVQHRLLAPQHRGRQARASLAHAGQHGKRHQLQSLLEDSGVDRRARHRPELPRGPDLSCEDQIRIFDGVDGPEIDPSLIDWPTTPPERYFFRQEPGAHNSLGTVKINFPNEHMVYMHDTPHRELFGRNVRFESSGCVRIDQVKTVVEWILQGELDVDMMQVEMVQCQRRAL